MTQTTREWEQPPDDLLDLAPVHKRTKRDGSDGQHSKTELQRVGEAYPEDGSSAHAVGSKEEDEIGRRQVEVYVFQAQQHGKQQTAVQQRGRLARKDQGQNQNPVEKSIVLKMDVIDDQQSRGKQDRQGGSMSGAPGGLW